MKWQRLRSADGSTWRDREDWPAGKADEVLMFSACDGFHLWRRWDKYTPPGTHWALPDKPEAAVREHRDAIKRHYGGQSPLA